MRVVALMVWGLVLCALVSLMVLNLHSSSSFRFYTSPASSIEQLKSAIKDVQFLVEHLSHNVTNIQPAVPRSDLITLGIPCSDKHFFRLPEVLNSLVRQTMMPFETMIVFSMSKNETSEEIDIVPFKTIPNMRMFFRSGRYYAGENRLFVAERAKTEYVSFFDCDDFMHPLRIEFLSKMMTIHPDIDALVTSFKFSYRDEFLKGDGYSRERVVDLTKASTFNMRWRFEDFWEAPIFKNGWNGKKWNMSDPSTEPNREYNSTWFLPMNMTTLSPSLSPMPHNGWLTLRRSIANPQSPDYIPFPNLPRGQDSLLNFRLIMSHKNFMAVPYRLGAYLATRPLKKPREI
eukprot:GHVN01026887.1.p1 GENE.GHVN01026887.1~~GHVN01026887.1.p1  ORF type:complete len:345 (+),score=33.29 GHVN01026887.1:43-1077(+)